MPRTPDMAGFLENFYSERLKFDDGQPDRLDRRRNLEPESAVLLQSLVAGINPDLVLELGTSNGYSTIWLADVRPLATVENDRSRAAEAALNLETAGVADRVQRIVADGVEFLATPGDAEWGIHHP